MRNLNNAIDIRNTVVDLCDRARVTGIVVVRMFSHALGLYAGHLGARHQARWLGAQGVLQQHALCVVPCAAAVVGTSVSTLTLCPVRRSQRLETPLVSATS